MKIYLSKYWRQSSLVELILMILLLVGAILFCVWSNDREDYIVVLCVACFELPLGCILLCSKRFLTYAIVEKDCICSYSIFSKKLCVVTTEKSIYYAVFTSPQGGINKNFIVFSNELFEYKDTYGISKVRFIQHYNTSKQIVLPYDEQTIPLLDFEIWHRVN